MNGQLMLIMLAERLMEIGARIIQVNTDGVLYLINKDAPYQEVLKQWEEDTKMTLETEDFEAFYQYAVNDYLGALRGYKESKDESLLKKKGLFIDEVVLGKGMQPMIIPKAINAYFTKGIPIGKTIRESKDINDFITYQKVGKQFYVELNGKQIANINRYYASTGGFYIYKINKETGKAVSLLTKSGLKIVNDLTQLKEFPKDINYEYYISEARKIVFPMEHTQLTLYSLFDNV